MPCSARLAIALVLAVGLAACDSNDMAGPPKDASGDDVLDALLAQESCENRCESEREQERVRQRTGPSMFDRLAEEIPAFGGMYRRTRCALVIVLTDLAETDLARAAIQEGLGPIMVDACPDGLVFGVVQGEFTYKELRRYLAASSQLLRLEDVNRVRIDYRQNRVVFGVSSREAARSVLAMLARLGVPEAAVALEHDERPERDDATTTRRTG